MSHVLRCSGYEVTKKGIVRAEGSYLYDSAGKRYVDFESGVWCTALGHGHPRVNAAICGQIEQIAHLAYRYTHPLTEEAAGEVLDSLAFPEGKCVFLSSGSEAVEFGVQVARRLSGRPLLLTLADAYLAAYGSAGRKEPEAWYAFDWSECAACSHTDGCDPECAHIREVPFERIGGFAFEPGNSGGRVKLPPRQLVQALTERVRERRGLLVVDEVTTGLGRTGAWYGFRHYDVQPDVVALGKGLGNGYPVSAVAMKPDVAERLVGSDFHYAQSHQNDPLGCAVAREVIRVVREEALVERSRRVGERFRHALEQVGERRAGIKEVRGRGLMIAVEFAEGFPIGSVYHGLLERGFIAGFKPAFNLLRFYPPLVVPEDDVARLVESLDAILRG